MSMRRFIGAAGAACTIAAGLPAAANADKVIEAQIVWRYDAMSYTMDQGEPLTFRNTDAVSPGPHNVTASDRGTDGRPLFASTSVPGGREVPVEGAQQLVTGSYGFFCTVHPFMQATLTVTDQGSPVPPPGEAPPPAADTQAPSVSVGLHRTTLRSAMRSRRFHAAITSDEPASLWLRLTARHGGRTIQLGTTTAEYREPGRRMAIQIRARRAGLRALRRARRVRMTLAVEARDAAGNLTNVTARRTIKR
jgi:plastocyanin